MGHTCSKVLLACSQGLEKCISAACLLGCFQATAELASEKGGLAARFASFVSGSMLAAQHGDKAMVDASQELWREMLQVGACTCPCPPRLSVSCSSCC